MPSPNAYDQPTEGGREEVERTLQKRSEPPPKQRAEGQKHLPKDNKTDHK